MNTINIKSFKNTASFKSTALMAIGLLTGIYSYAQSDLRLSVGSQSHYAKIELESSKFESSFEPGAGIAAGISIGLNDRWSLHSGLGLNYFQSRNAARSYSGTQDAVDISEEAFEFRYSASNYSEIQKLTALGIPLAIQYETKGTVRFYSKLGVDANFFISEESDSRTKSLTTTGFFPRFNAELDGPRFAGFGTYSNQEFNEEDLDLKNSYNATLELGIKQIYTSGNALYIGVFFKYGLNDLSTSGENGLISFDPQNPTSFRSTSIINAIDNPRNGSDRVSDQANLHVFGTALRYEFDF